jgi:uncharacterized protein YcaQ
LATQTPKPPTPISISADEAAALLLQSQGLLDSPSRRATRASLHGAIRRLGYVQIDSINVVARAHDLILRARFENYRPEQLSRLVSKDRVLFENWVHDAAMIPVDFASQWRHIQRVYAKARRERMAGRSGTRQFGRLCNQVRRRIEEEGPLMSSDFEDPRAKSGTWWSWKPAKVALEYLWRTGELVICERENFHKRYELTERFLPDLCMAKPATRRQFVDWACSSALERLGTATNRDLSDYWGHLSAADASAWCARAIARGDAVPVEIASKGPGRPRQAVAVTGWRERLNRVPESPAGVRLLAPFDPVIRDRTRLKHLFDFDYRFEAFVPAARRRHGYYTMPLWRGTRAIGRFNPKLDRAADTLQVRGLCLEPDVRPTKRLNGEIDEALDGFREWLGAKHLMIEK